MKNLETPGKTGRVDRYGRVSSRLQEYPFLSKISFCSHAAEAILFVDLKKTAKHDVIIPDYSKYSALWSRMLFRNSVNRTHPKIQIWQK